MINKVIQKYLDKEKELKILYNNNLKIGENNISGELSSLLNDLNDKINKNDNYKNVKEKNEKFLEFLNKIGNIKDEYKIKLNIIFFSKSLHIFIKHMKLC